MKFRTVISDSIDISVVDLADGFPELRDVAMYDYLRGDLVVEWDVDFEVRSWGVKDVYITVTAVDGTFELQKYNEAGDEIGSQVVDINPAEWRFDAKFTFTEYNTLSPSEVEIDYSTKTITVS